MKPGWTVNRAFFDTPTVVHREVGVPAGDGASNYRKRVVGRWLAQVQDPALLQTSDQQGRPGVDLARTVYFPEGTDVRAGDTIETDDLRMTVQSAADRSGLYRKCLVVEEHGS